MKVYLSKQNFLLSYRELVLSQMYIFLPHIGYFKFAEKTRPLFFYFVWHTGQLVCEFCIVKHC